MPQNQITLQQKPTRTQHRIIWPFVLLSIVIIFLGVRYLYSTFSKSVGYQIPDWLQSQLTNSSEEDTIAALKAKDTDQDGLTDYQEIYQYYTSMFLPDTDSDGSSDFNEATTGEDALCPKGEDCNLLHLITPQTRLADLIQEVSVDPNLTLEAATAAEFRKFLLQNGLTQEELDEFSDSDLLAIFAIINESQIIPEAEWSATTTPDQIRQFLLIQPNANADSINNLSDQELLKIRDALMGA